MTPQYARENTYQWVIIDFYFSHWDNIARQQMQNNEWVNKGNMVDHQDGRTLGRYIFQPFYPFLLDQNGKSNPADQEAQKRRRN